MIVEEHPVTVTEAHLAEGVRKAYRSAHLAEGVRRVYGPGRSARFN